MSRIHSLWAFWAIVGWTFHVYSDNDGVYERGAHLEGSASYSLSAPTTWTQWADDYANALKMAQATGKPLLLAFMGSGWCPWSIKMEEDILSKTEFSTAMCEDVLFVRLDFPQQDVLSLEKKVQFNNLKRRYMIQELPTLVLVDASGEEIYKIGYVPMEAQEVAACLKMAIRDYLQIKNVVGTPMLQEMKGEEIRDLYKKAHVLSANGVRQQLLEAGLKSDQDAFFLMVQYESLLHTSSLQDSQVQQLRRKIAAQDPGGVKGIQLKLATVEFNILAKQLKKREDPQRAIAPLLAYLQKFGHQDVENGWRIEMEIAQFLFSKNKLEEAVEHAKNSYDKAPIEFRCEIAQSLEYLTKKAEKR